ncbi:MAG: DUF4194 domain-containing protein [Candidatus Phytoplasma stylosanthis]|uniref:DUF4194 domain-containing protein n=1 Tax=Candidatus Phytoplasma stylosanthis TaxID=2798314 RepID=UPI00293A1163|nr:DUF4194 domain-containing protein [Candidatus Phytoplasma stylosanthis]MDV3168122.1 DUF4194 domain-containing protein [Candidatus Phytoplasma stylosanthis]MDV3171105.1 DUF4194 domain-containing protein [Candidatus Phytoplasma stylosanthis]MDV3173710.1 DUF4194 domain-containing protein [Candidatus Phytoplasma stylosanthis]MDV3174319.1 DUF4194 domain-containing protein [Candidatus Phytoplasma stylosanthis]MDV3202638.1 DUF4194 domain-containing protein [Candidatus Phytoplasma stylosanthis]
MKEKEIDIFVDNFKKIKEQEKKIFSRIVNKLFQVNYLTIQKKEDINDYHFILLQEKLFSSFFKLIDFKLEIKKYDGVIFIKNLLNFNKLKLKKEESLILLILRVLFQDKKETTANNIIQIYLKDIYHKLYNINYKEIKKLNKSKIKNILSLLKKHNIINLIDDNDILKDDSIIQIYPSIIYLIDLDMIEEYQKIFNSKENKNN